MANEASRASNAVPCRPVASKARNRGVLNTKVFASPFEACLDETMVTFSSELMDSPVNVTQQRAVLKTLSKNFQREIKAIHAEKSYVSEMCHYAANLTDNAHKMIFGVYRAARPY